VASGFSIASMISPQSVLPVGDTPVTLRFALYAAARPAPRATFVFVAIYQRSAKLSLFSGFGERCAIAGCRHWRVSGRRW
jgi:hypothetical protein